MENRYIPKIKEPEPIPEPGILAILISKITKLTNCCSERNKQEEDILEETMVENESPTNPSQLEPNKKSSLTPHQSKSFKTSTNSIKDKIQDTES